jgi:predicted ArsR family transcriptional regulator
MEMRGTVMVMPGTHAVNSIEALGALSDPVRRRLYEYVAGRHEAVGRDDAAAAMQIGRPLAAFHLDRLARDGLLDVEFRRLNGRSGPGAGRPSKLYRRSRRELSVSLPARRYGVAAELFATVLDAEGEAAGGAIRAAGHEYGLGLARAARAMAPGKSKRSPVQAAAQTELLAVLAEVGFEPDVDATGTIRLRNCPFDALVPEHRQLTCGMNLAVLEGVADGLGSRTLAPVRRTEPGYCCVAFDPVAPGPT